jgi:predicted ester cyclase
MNLYFDSTHVWIYSFLSFYEEKSSLIYGVLVAATVVSFVLVKLLHIIRDKAYRNRNLKGILKQRKLNV